MLSIHYNLSAGAQNVTGAYVLIMLVYRCLLTMRLHGKPANNAQKQQKLFVQGYNLEVRDLIKYTQKHHATVTNYITCKPGFCVM